MTFRGWPAEAIEFYEGLEADNTRTYWTEHKARYEQDVLAPMTELLDELGPEFGDTRIFRPYRDLRFSRDKTPYKTHIGGVVGEGYIQLSATGLGVGQGMYSMAPDQLSAYRRAVAAELPGTELEQLAADLQRQGIGLHTQESLKTAPRGYDPGHPRIGLLRYKGLWAWQEWPAAAWMGTGEVRVRVTRFLRETAPLAHWLARHVGPSAEPARRR
jgi:uncharacterized protein (TIGR02453 family)